MPDGHHGMLSCFFLSAEMTCSVLYWLDIPGLVVLYLFTGKHKLYYTADRILYWGVGAWKAHHSSANSLLHACLSKNINNQLLSETVPVSSQVVSGTNSVQRTKSTSGQCPCTST